MTHGALREQLLDLAYGELSGHARRAVEKHVAGCDGCRAELERIRVTRRAMSALPPEPAPDHGESVLLAAAREAARAKERERPPRLLPGWLWGATIGALGVAAVVAVSVRVLELGPRRAREDDFLMGREGQAPRDGRTGEAPRDLGPPPAAPPEAAAAPSGGGLATAAPESPAPAKTAPARKAAKKPAAPVRREEEQTKEAAGFASPPPAPYAEAPAPAFATPPPYQPSVSPPAEPEKGAVAPAQRRASSARPFAAPPAAAVPGADLDVTDDPVARFERLARSGRLITEVLERGLCPGETRRQIDRDSTGRIVRFLVRVAEGDAREVEGFYAGDGRLAAIRTTLRQAQGTVRAGGSALVRMGPDGLAPGRIPRALPLHAGEIREDVPPRCP